MIERLKFALFALYNSMYRDGNYRRNTPRLNVALLAVMFQGFLILLAVFLYQLMLYVRYGPLDKVMPLPRPHIPMLLLFGLNCLVLRKTRVLERLYQRYAYQDKPREKRYRIAFIIIYLFCAIIGIVIAGFSKAWFTK